MHNGQLRAGCFADEPLQQQGGGPVGAVSGSDDDAGGGLAAAGEHGLSVRFGAKPGKEQQQEGSEQAHGSEFKGESAAAKQFVVADAVLGQGLAAEAHATDIFPVAVLFDGERTLRGVDFGPVENGRGERIERLAGTIGIEPQHGKDGPRRHGARVVVTGDAVAPGGEILVQQPPRFALGAPLLAAEAAEKVGVGDVGLVGRVVEPLVEDPLQLVDELPAPAHELGQPLDVVGHEERIVPGRTLVETRDGLEVLALPRVEGA